MSNTYTLKLEIYDLPSNDINIGENKTDDEKENQNNNTKENDQIS